MTDATLHMRIDLAGLAGRIQRLLKQVSYMAAIGMRAGEDVSDESLNMPEMDFIFVYDHSNPWSAEEAKNHWKRWVLTNAFRDAAEAIAGILEEAQQVLSIWALMDPSQKQLKVKLSKWKKEVEQRQTQFHRRTLPQKLEFLRDVYGFVLDDRFSDEALSINATRNCLVHRSGQVAKIDTDSSGMLILKWRQLIPYVEVDGGEQELVLPFFAKKDTLLSIRNDSRSRSFSEGDLVEVSLKEFTGICWTIYSLAQWIGQALEAHGRAKGFAIGERTTP